MEQEVSMRRRRGLIAAQSKWADLGDGCVFEHDPDSNPDCDSPPPPPPPPAPAEEDLVVETLTEDTIGHVFGMRVVGRVFNDQPMTVADLIEYVGELAEEEADPTAVVCAWTGELNAVRRIAAVHAAVVPPEEATTLTLPEAPPPPLQVEAGPQLPTLREDPTGPPPGRVGRRPIARRGRW